MKKPFRVFTERLKEIRKRPPSPEIVKKIEDLVRKEESSQSEENYSGCAEIAAKSD